MPTDALTSSEIYLPDTPVIQTIYIAPDFDYDSDEIVYNSDGKLVPYYEQVEDEGGINPQDKELVDTRVETKTTGQVDANNSSPELTLAAPTTMTVKVIKDHLKARNRIVWGNKPDILLRLRQAIEANAPIVTGLDPNILYNMVGTSFAPMEHWGLIVTEDIYVVTEEGEYHYLTVIAVKYPAAGPRKKNYVKQFNCPPFMRNVKLQKRTKW